MPSPDDFGFVLLIKTPNRIEAEIIKTKLSSFGIDSELRGETIGRLYGITLDGLATTEVFVPAPQHPQALEILKAKT